MKEMYVVYIVNTELDYTDIECVVETKEDAKKIKLLLDPFIKDRGEIVVFSKIKKYKDPKKFAKKYISKKLY